MSEAVKKDNRVFTDLKASLENPESVSLAQGEKLYGLPVLWGIMQDSYQSAAELAGHEILRVALESMCHLLS